MVYVESFCAAAFSVGSVVCLVRLVSPRQQPPVGTNSVVGGYYSEAVFVACLFVTCVLSAVAMWRVKGPHACWHGSPWISSAENSATCAALASRSSSSSSTFSGSGKNTRDITMERKGADEADSPPLGGAGASPSTYDDNILESVGDDVLMEPFPLERRSSFVEVALRIHG